MRFIIKSKITNVDVRRYIDFYNRELRCVNFNLYESLQTQNYSFEFTVTMLNPLTTN